MFHSEIAIRNLHFFANKNILIFITFTEINGKGREFQKCQKRKKSFFLLSVNENGNVDKNKASEKDINKFPRKPKVTKFISVIFFRRNQKKRNNLNEVVSKKKIGTLQNKNID